MIKYIIISLLIIFAFVPYAEAVQFSYDKPTATETAFNVFETRFLVPKNFPVETVIEQINTEKVFNIEVDGYEKVPYNATWSYMIIRGHLKEYTANGGKNRLFNPWWNTSFELKENYYVTGASYLDNMRINTAFNKSDRWIYNNQTEMSFYREDSNYVWLKIPTAGSYYIQKYVNASGAYSSASSCANTFEFCDVFQTDLNNWTVSGAAVIEGEEVKMTGDGFSWTNNNIYTNSNFTVFDRNKTIHLKTRSTVYRHAMSGLSVTPLTVDTGIFWNQHTTGNYYYRIDSTSTPNGTYATGSNHQYLHYNTTQGFYMELNNATKAANSSYNNPLGANKIVLKIYSAGTIYFDDIYIVNRSTATITRLFDYGYPPDFVTWSNNYTVNNTSVVYISSNQTIEFSVQTDYPSDYYEWDFNGSQLQYNGNNTTASVAAYGFNTTGSHYINITGYTWIYNTSSYENITRMWTVYFDEVAPVPTPAPYNNSQIDEAIEAARDDLIIFVFVLFMIAMVYIKKKRG